MTTTELSVRVIYDDSDFAVRDDLPASHTRFWRRLGAPGSWLTSAERLAVAREVRAAADCELCARRKAALSPYGVEGGHSGSADLDALRTDVVHRITTDASRLTGDWYRGVIDSGLTAGEYVEIVGTVVALVSIDSFARALGLEPRELPSAGEGAPDGYRPVCARQEEAWVPVVPLDNAATPEEDLWPAGRTGWVVRAMSLVPEEVRTLKDLSDAHYLPMKDVADPTVSRGSLDRAQIELIAGRVSALNECFY